MLFAYAAFIGLSAVFLAVMPILYRILAVGAGTMPPYPGLVIEGALFMKLMFSSSVLYWVVLWSVKLSLLFVFRRLIVLLPRYVKGWWFVLTFTLLAFVGCFITNITSCSSMKAWFILGESPAELNTNFRLTCSR
jgi:hypothetical protein